MRPAKPRIFLSYGHRDAGELADRLRRDLASAFDVWHDSSAIRVGHAWTDEIRDGIRASQLLVAVLSPHSVRRASNLRNPAQAESVCLDEIEYAVDACRIPVVPVMAATCEPPFRIFRLQYLDFRRWREKQSGYRALRQQLEDAIGVALETRRSPVRQWGWLPEPWDFGPFLAARRRRFAGRNWMFREIERWRKRERSPALLIVGPPGVGKSAIVAQLVHDNPGGQVLGCHCCQADTLATLDPGLFVRSLAGQLSARLEGFAAAIEHPAIRDQLSAAATGDDPASAFEAGILAPLSSLPAAPDGGRYLLIDALDEAILRPKGRTILDLLVTRLDRFPPWLKVIATTQPQPDVLRRLAGIETRTIEGQDPRNKHDVAVFISARLAEPVFEAPIRRSRLQPAQIRTALQRASDGNFQFATTFLDGVERGHIEFREAKTLPPGLWSLYRIYFDRLYGDSGLCLDYAPARALLEVAVSAFSPPAASELAEVLGIDPDYRFPEVLQPIAAFFTVNDGAYAVFHGSLSDWLTSRDAANQGAAGKYSISVTAGHERWSQYWLRKFDAGDLPSSLVRSLPAHLAGAGRWDDGARVVLDPHFIAAKIGGLTTTALDLQADCTMLLARLPASHSSRPLIAALNHVIVRQGQNLRRADLSPLDQLILQARLDKSAELAAILEGASPEARDRFELKWSTYAPDPTFRRPWRLGSSDNYLLSISADGGRALCGGGGNLILLDLVAGEVAQRINAHAKGVNACLLSAAGTRAVTQPDGSSDLHVWDVPLLQRARTLRLHRESPWPWGLAMSADGRLLVTCNQGNRTSLLTLWDLDDGHAIRVFKKPGLRRASCAAIAGGASKLLSAHDGGHLVLWDLEGGVIDMVRVDHDGPLTECDISSDGALALAGGGQTLAVWDLTARRVWERPDGAWGEMALALSADGRCALSGGSDGLVVVWNLDPKSPLRALSGNTRNDVWCVASSADGRRGLSSTKGGNTVEWDLQNTGGHAPAAAGHGDWIWRCTISADGHRSATLSGQRLTVWDNRSGRAVRSLHVSDGHYWAGLALNASGSRASFTNGLEVKYWNLETPKELPVPDAESPQLSAEVDDENLWTRFGIVPPRAFHVEGHEGAVRKLELDGSGQLLYASSNGQLGSWLVRDRTQRAPIPVTGDSVEYCTLTDPDTLLVVSDDGTVMLWDLRAERIRASICIGEVTCATGTRDGSLVLLGNGFGDVFALGRCVNTPSAMEDDFFAPRSPRGARV